MQIAGARKLQNSGESASAPVEVMRNGDMVLPSAGADEGDGGLVVGGQAQGGHEGHHAQRAGDVVVGQSAHHAVQRRRLHHPVRPRHVLHQIQRLINPAFKPNCQTISQHDG